MMVHGRKAAEGKRQRRKKGRKGGARGGRVLALPEAVEILVGGRSCFLQAWCRAVRCFVLLLKATLGRAVEGEEGRVRV